MIDFSRIMGFDWDDGNARKSIDKHHVSQREAEQAFVDPRLLILADEKHATVAEVRFQAYGATEVGRRLTVSFTLRQDATLIRVISARDMSRKERSRYEQEA
jgi:uncharacterized DUF497 family protein